MAVLASPSHYQNLYTQHFGSITEMVDAGDHAWKDRKRSRRCDGFDNAHFVGRAFSGWEDIKEKANEPWEHGLLIVQEMLLELGRRGVELPAPKERKRRKAFSCDRGDEVCYDRLRGGQEDFWIDCRRTNVLAPQFVTIITDINTPSHRDSDEILYRGASAIVISDLLEKAGYRTEIVACHHNADVYRLPGQRNYQSVFTTCKVKDSHTPLDTSAVVNALSGWFYRTVFFQAYYTHPTILPCPSMGTCLRLNEKSDLLRDLAGNGSRAFLIEEIWDVSSAIQRISEVINSLNAGTALAS